MQIKINICSKKRETAGLPEGQLVRDIGLLPPSDFGRTLRTDEASEGASHRIENWEYLFVLHFPFSFLCNLLFIDFQILFPQSL